jgi:pilus assembly protein CpaE
MSTPLSFVVLSTGLETFKQIRNALSEDRRARLLAGGDDAEQLLTEIGRLKPSAAIIAMGPSSHEQTHKLISKIAAESPQTAIICAAHDSSPDTILNSLRAGAHEFLRIPIITSEFKTVLDRVSEHCSNQVDAPKKKGKTIAVFSSKGGCGTSFIATNLGAALGQPTVLVDLNLQAGDLGLFLGVEPKFTVADFVENRSRMDDSLLSSYLTQYSENLHLLSAPREADSADDIEPEHIYEMIEFLRQHFEYVVIDPQHTFDAITLSALDQADEVVLVLTLDIPAIRSAQRTLAIFDRLGYPRHKVRVVVNRWSKHIDLDLAQVQKFLGERILGYVQSDYKLAVDSINLGKPLVHSQPSANMTAEIVKIAKALGGKALPVTEGQENRRGLLKGMFRKQPRTATASFDMATLLD